jgi:hypothetical protein
MNSREQTFRNPNVLPNISRIDIALECAQFLSAVQTPDQQTFTMMIKFLCDKYDQDTGKSNSPMFAIISEIASFFSRQVIVIGKQPKEAFDLFLRDQALTTQPKQMNIER